MKQTGVNLLPGRLNRILDRISSSFCVLFLFARPHPIFSKFIWSNRPLNHFSDRRRLKCTARPNQNEINKNVAWQSEWFNLGNWISLCTRHITNSSLIYCSFVFETFSPVQLFNNPPRWFIIWASLTNMTFFS